MNPATELKSAYTECNPDVPLSAGNIRYVDLSKVRGEEQNFVDIIAKAINYNLPEDNKCYRQLVTGHRGCGKSTELLRLQTKLEQDKFFVVYFDVELMLNLGDIDYIDILLLIAHQVEAAFRKQEIDLDPTLLEDVYQWLADTVLSKERQKDIHANVGIEAETGVTIPLFSKLLARVSAGIRSNDLERQEIRSTLRKEWYLFVEKLNTLLDQARTKARKNYYRDLVVIVDGLEKVFYEPERDGNGHFTGESTHSLLFIKHAEQLDIPNCHLIYTVPISLLFNANLSHAFDIDTPVIIPMVNIKKAEGVEQLVTLVEKRLVIEDIFADRTLVEKLVKMSGGAVRDLMRLIRIACLNTTMENIDSGSVERAIRSFIREYSRLIQEKDIEALKYVNQNKRVTGDEIFSRLLHNRVVHEYQNGESWADLHPAVREIQWVMDRLNDSTQ